MNCTYDLYGARAVVCACVLPRSLGKGEDRSEESEGASERTRGDGRMDGREAAEWRW